VLDSGVGEVDLPRCPGWIYLNSSGSGYYRTVWSEEQLRGLLEAGLPLTLAEKLTLVEDLRALRATGAEVKAVLLRLSNEVEPVVATTAFAALRVVP
jgi:hypothetical protein